MPASPDHESEPPPIWRDPPPGRIGILLLHAGLLGRYIGPSERADRADLFEQGVWEATCPVCDGPATLMGPPHMRRFEGGELVCEPCLAAPADYHQEVWRALAARLEVGDALRADETISAVQEIAAELLADVLPPVLWLPMPGQQIIEVALAALSRVPELRVDRGKLVWVEPGNEARRLNRADMETLLSTILLTVRGRRRRRAQLPRSLPGQMLKLGTWPGVRDLRDQAQARQLLFRAIDRATVVRERDWVTAVDLIELEFEAIQLAAQLVARTLDPEPRLVGELLSSLQLAPGEGGPGFVADGRVTEGSKWKLVR